jgi:type II secretory ATPase GspE/PulE/Tfp pilus assembly ATPase PilB-like protein
MKVKSFLLPSTLNIIIAQRLVQKLCPHCKEKVRPNKEVENVIIEHMESLPEKDQKSFSRCLKRFYIYKAKGCPKCNMKGEKGEYRSF